MDYPGAVFPTGLCVEPADKPDAEYAFASEADREVWAACESFFSRGTREMGTKKSGVLDDSPDTFAGAPLGLQVVGQRWEDEKVMAALEVISRIVRGEA